MYDDPLEICDAYFNLTLRFTIAQNGFDIGGSCAVVLDLPDPPFNLWDPDIRFSIDVSTSGFTVDLNVLGRYTISW